MKEKTLLIVDDELSILTTLEGALSDEEYQVYTAQNGKEALDLLKKHEVQIVLLDIWMSPMGGLETLKNIKSQFPNVGVIMMSGHGNIETAVIATKMGAYDYVEKPLSLEKLILVIQNLLSALALGEENKKLKEQNNESYELIGESPAMKKIKQLIALIAPTNSWILITGENGTGKELVAHELHHLSQRRGHAFVAVNCAAIPENLIESELFGHEKGAFTGAYAQKRGKFDLANGGTLFLDEIGDMSLNTQAKILRILQEQRFERIGGNQTIQIDVRVIAATNKNLLQEIENGCFREDLYYRLNVIPFKIPSLRERKDDIEDLASYFLDQIAQKNGKEKKKLNPDALKKLKSYEWPGNVRELRNLIERFDIMTEGPVIEAKDIVLPIVTKAFDDMPDNLKDARGEFEKVYIQKKLEENHGNVSETAKAIGLERTHLHRKIKQYQIKI